MDVFFNRMSIIGVQCTLILNTNTNLHLDVLLKIQNQWFNYFIFSIKKWISNKALLLPNSIEFLVYLTNGECFQYTFSEIYSIVVLRLYIRYQEIQAYWKKRNVAKFNDLSDSKQRWISFDVCTFINAGVQGGKKTVIWFLIRRTMIKK